MGRLLWVFGIFCSISGAHVYVYVDPMPEASQTSGLNRPRAGCLPTGLPVSLLDTRHKTNPRLPTSPGTVEHKKQEKEGGVCSNPYLYFAQPCTMYLANMHTKECALGWQAGCSKHQEHAQQHREYIGSYWRKGLKPQKTPQKTSQKTPQRHSPAENPSKMQCWWNPVVEKCSEAPNPDLDNISQFQAETREFPISGKDTVDRPGAWSCICCNSKRKT
ncbi:hypothetical protein MKZ38_009208 [Zalerion maritima]|uniref:Uncharacterized protein n=1 Tax=Zalerion maritima TaxID=339359 RepID=A0AAD5RGQ0_9PEZI|nr:hypothetical protein MKZ38_009208 [Zalerion maritima]